MQSDDSFLGIVIEVLANDQDCLTVTVAIGTGKFDVGGQRYIAGHLLPCITKLIARVPDVIAGGVHRVLLCVCIETRAAWYHGTANVGLALEDTDRRVEIPAWLVEVCGRAHLCMRGRTWKSKGWNLRRRGLQGNGPRQDLVADERETLAVWSPGWHIDAAGTAHKPHQHLHFVITERHQPQHHIPVGRMPRRPLFIAEKDE